jgi:hypothetical protein
MNAGHAKTCARAPLLALGLAAVLLGSLVLRAESAVGPRARQVRGELRAPVLVGGIDVGETELPPLSAAMQRSGLSTLQVSYDAQLTNWDGADLEFAEREPGALRARLRAAREAGLSVMLVLRLRLSADNPRNRHLWHGLTWPDERSLDAFFARYREYVLWAADLARDEGVAMLVVGNELNALAGTGVDVPDVLARALNDAQLDREAEALRGCRADGPVRWHDGGAYPDIPSAVAGEQRALRAWGRHVAGPAEGRRERLRARRARHDEAWRAILDETRARFDGLVSYGAGFDSYDEVGFWDATDALVSTAYFGLRRVGEASEVDNLKRVWTRHLAGLARAAAARPSRPELPVYLGELGFTRRADCAVRPWSYEGFETLPRADGASACVAWADHPLAPQERAQALNALADALSDGALPQLRGFSLWKLTLQDEHAALEPYAIRLNAPGRPLTSRARSEAGALAAIKRLSNLVRERDDRTEQARPR